MANKKKKKRVILIISICVIIIVIILLCILRFIVFSKDDETENLVELAINEEVNFAQKEQNIEKYVDGKTIPQGVSSFISEYKGEVDRDTFYEKLYTVSRYLPDLTSNLKEIDDYEAYYENNSTDIKKYLGINDSNDFVELANYLLENDVSEDEFDYCSYEDNTMNNYGNYSVFRIKFTYVNYGDIEFSIKLSNNSSSGVSCLAIVVPNT